MSERPLLRQDGAHQESEAATGKQGGSLFSAREVCCERAQNTAAQSQHTLGVISDLFQSLQNDRKSPGFSWQSYNFKYTRQTLLHVFNELLSSLS